MLDGRQNPISSISPLGFYNPLAGGGSLLTIIPVTYPMGQGEPVNVVISKNSDPRVLVDQENSGGLRTYFLSLGFSGECLGQHDGSHQGVDLGGGNGPKNEVAVLRWNYGDAELGTCKETVEGGNHFRYWIQNGQQGNSGAVFMAVSYEKSLSDQHDVLLNGYNLGRDWMIGNITHSSIPSHNLTNGTTYSGTTTSSSYTYNTEVLYLSGILPNTSYGINHNVTVVDNGINASDGLLAVLNVTITGEPGHLNVKSCVTLQKHNLLLMNIFIRLGVKLALPFDVLSMLAFVWISALLAL
ncbi:hypothetical protein FA15DRAFT_640390 [Coprinopsis marcescibilis]|uniref:Uncharacterized protein n=1 Tax=Coprinopsis marcescibilis TaxID=230819 RepID=A0A5C3KXR4_COPMA|nr:hypothetical protein FA15DRAFT_640390 [Coprinopsis marcescibilis]